MGNNRHYDKILLVALLLTTAIVLTRVAAPSDAPTLTQPSAELSVAKPSTVVAALASEVDDSGSRAVAIPGSDRPEVPSNAGTGVEQDRATATQQPESISSGNLPVEREGSERAQPSSRGGHRPPLIAEDLGAVEPTPAASAPAEPAVTPSPRPAEPSTYVVTNGDTLLHLADRFGISPDTILWANNLEGGADDLQVGQNLTILPVSGVLHEVSMGDTVEEIAAAHEVEMAAVVEANRLDDPDAILVGQNLVVPGGKPEVRQPPAGASVGEATNVRDAQPAEVRAAGGTGMGAEIVKAASRFAGYSYTWGGHSPATGFDCTGFTWYVYGQVGLTIPLHDLWGQLGSGPRVSQAELLPGDLVFFQNTYQPGLSHAGLYVGNRTFIHAASERTGVRYDSLDDAYWGPRYFGASRPW